jgi:Leucine-rich repeat (LRR) protein
VYVSVTYWATAHTRCVPSGDDLRLDLSGQGLTRLTPSGEQLRSLDLRGNPLGNVPESLRDLARLTHLGLSQTGLSSVPEWLWSLRGLQALNLSENQIANVSDGLAKLGGLRMLDLEPQRTDGVTWRPGRGALERLPVSEP